MPVPYTGGGHAYSRSFDGGRVGTPPPSALFTRSTSQNRRESLGPAAFSGGLRPPVTGGGPTTADVNTRHEAVSRVLENALHVLRTDGRSTGEFGALVLGLLEKETAGLEQTCALIRAARTPSVSAAAAPAAVASRMSIPPLAAPVAGPYVVPSIPAPAANGHASRLSINTDITSAPRAAPPAAAAAPSTAALARDNWVPPSGPPNGVRSPPASVAGTETSGGGGIQGLRTKIAGWKFPNVNVSASIGSALKKAQGESESVPSSPEKPSVVAASDRDKGKEPLRYPTEPPPAQNKEKDQRDEERHSSRSPEKDKRKDKERSSRSSRRHRHHSDEEDEENLNSDELMARSIAKRERKARRRERRAERERRGGEHGQTVLSDETLESPIKGFPVAGGIRKAASDSGLGGGSEKGDRFDGDRPFDPFGRFGPSTASRGGHAYTSSREGGSGGSTDLPYMSSRHHAHSASASEDRKENPAPASSSSGGPPHGAGMFIPPFDLSRPPPGAAMDDESEDEALSPIGMGMLGMSFPFPGSSAAHRHGAEPIVIKIRKSTGAMSPDEEYHPFGSRSPFGGMPGPFGGMRRGGRSPYDSGDESQGSRFTEITSDDEKEIKRSAAAKSKRKDTSSPPSVPQRPFLGEDMVATPIEMDATPLPSPRAVPASVSTIRSFPRPVSKPRVVPDKVATRLAHAVSVLPQHTRTLVNLARVSKSMKKASLPLIYGRVTVSSLRQMAKLTDTLLENRELAGMVKEVKILPLDSPVMEIGELVPDVARLLEACKALKVLDEDMTNTEQDVIDLKKDYPLPLVLSFQLSELKSHKCWWEIGAAVGLLTTQRSLTSVSFAAVMDREWEGQKLLSDLDVSTGAKLTSLRIDQVMHEDTLRVLLSLAGKNLKKLYLGFQQIGDSDDDTPRHSIAPALTLVSDTLVDLTLKAPWHKSPDAAGLVDECMAVLPRLTAVAFDEMGGEKGIVPIASHKSLLAISPAVKTLTGRNIVSFSTGDVLALLDRPELIPVLETVDLQWAASVEGQPTQLWSVQEGKRLEKACAEFGIKLKHGAGEDVL